MQSNLSLLDCIYKREESQAKTQKGLSMWAQTSNMAKQSENHPHLKFQEPPFWRLRRKAKMSLNLNVKGGCGFEGKGCRLVGAMLRHQKNRPESIGMLEALL